MKFTEILLTGYFWFFTVLSILLVTPICIILYPFIDEKTFSKIFICIPANILSFVMYPFWEIKIKDLRKNKSWDKNYVVVANHLSFIDSLIISFVVPVKMKFMIGNIFTKIPLFGWMVKMAGYVTADINDPELNKNAVERAVKTIKKDDSSFTLFPEGRRQLKSYTFETFKTGAYRISRETNLSILPITLDGTVEAMGFGAIVNYAKIKIFIDEPFDVVDNDYQKYINKTKEIMLTHLKNKIN
jgi:1-acyl-sn-glycerol-3-phosphate acyltransferase